MRTVGGQDWFRPAPVAVADRLCGGAAMVTEQSALSFAGLLRRLRADAKLTQEELAAAAGVSPRSVSNLERGINRTAHKDTAVLLAGALGLTGPAEELFVAAARRNVPAPPGPAAAPGNGQRSAAPTRAPRDELALRVAPRAGADAAAVRRGLAADPDGFALTARQAALARPHRPPGANGSMAERDQPSRQGRLLLVVDQFEELFTQC